MWVAIVTVFVSGIIGYILGTIKFFREQQHRVYSEILPPIIKAGFDPTPKDMKEFNEALCKVWLHCSRTVAVELNRAAAILHNPERGNFLKTIQGVTAIMRDEVQLTWLRPWQKVEPKEVEHFYSQVGRY